MEWVTGNGLDMSVERWFVGMKRKGMKTRGVKQKYGMHGAKETDCDKMGISMHDRMES